MNLKIKFRESFRPFAPSVLEERASEWFELDCESPYMLLVADVRPEKRQIPAVTHVDGSARIQTVRRADHPLYYDLIARFGRFPHRNEAMGRISTQEEHDYLASGGFSG